MKAGRYVSLDGQSSVWQPCGPATALISAAASFAHWKNVHGWTDLPVVTGLNTRYL